MNKKKYFVQVLNIQQTLGSKFKLGTICVHAYCQCYGGGSYQGEVDRHKSEEGVHTNLIKGGHQNQIVECSKENLKKKTSDF